MKRVYLLLGLALCPGWLGAHMSPREPVANAANTLEVEIGEGEVKLLVAVDPAAREVFDGKSGLRMVANRSEELEFERGEWREQPKVLRDEWTGRALPGEGGRGAPVLVAEWRVELASKPEVLEIVPPLGGDGRPLAKIGFITRHRGLEVNDYALLDRPRELLLDWGDPWATKFRDPKLRRAFGEAVELFVVREAKGLRVEVAARPVVLLPGLEEGLADPERIAPSERVDVAERLVGALESGLQVSVDGRRVSANETTLNFVRRSILGAEPVAGGEPVELSPAVVGAVMRFDAASAVEEIGIRCGLFSERVQRIPLAFRDGTSARRAMLAPDRPEFRWERGAREVVPADPVPEGGIFVGWMLKVPWALLVVIPGLAWVWMGRRRSFWVRWLPLPVLVAGVGFATGWRSWAIEVPDPRVAEEPLAEEEANAIAERLLRGVFGSFNERGDEARREELAKWASDPSEVEEGWGGSLEAKSLLGTPVRFRRLRLEDRKFLEAPSSRGIRFEGRLRLTLGNEHWGHAHTQHERFPVTVEIRPTWLGWRVESLSLR